MAAPSHAAPPATALQLAALRATGADPVRLCHIEALARRAMRHEGAARRLLDDRVQQLLATAAAPARPAVAVPAVAAGAAETAAPRGEAQRETLAELLAHINRHNGATTSTSTSTAAPGAANGAGAPELKAVRDYRSTWSRLSVEHRLTQALAKVPDNAGPLNTQRLLHEALAAMRHASPQYLHRFMVQVEALLWLDQLSPGAAVADKKAGARADRGAGRGPARGRARQIP